MIAHATHGQPAGSVLKNYNKVKASCIVISINILSVSTCCVSISVSVMASIVCMPGMSARKLILTDWQVAGRSGPTRMRLSSDIIPDPDEPIVSSLIERLYRFSRPSVWPCRLRLRSKKVTSKRRVHVLWLNTKMSSTNSS